MVSARLANDLGVMSIPSPEDDGLDTCEGEAVGYLFSWLGGLLEGELEGVDYVEQDALHVLVKVAGVSAPWEPWQRLAGLIRHVIDRYTGGGQKESSLTGSQRASSGCGYCPN